jgi:putative Holliday junction resolvase
MSNVSPSTDPSRVLALDLGQRRIGVALSDEGRTIAQPLTVLPRSGRDHDVYAIAALCKAHGVGLIVIGLPEPLPGAAPSPMAEQAQRLGQRLARVTGLPVEYVDEFETTVEARELLLEADSSRDRRRQVVDKLAAAIILRRWLDQHPLAGC